MLKIKDDVDLKKLEKFGFRYTKNKNSYIKEIYVGDCDLIVDADKILYYDNYSTADMTYHSYQLLEKIYNLIQTGLVEKIGEK